MMVINRHGTMTPTAYNSTIPFKNITTLHGQIKGLLSLEVKTIGRHTPHTTIPHNNFYESVIV
jgi:hypothetical protein